MFNLAVKKYIHYLNKNLGVQCLIPVSIYGESFFLFHAFFDKNSLPNLKPLEIEIDIFNFVTQQQFYKQVLKYTSVEFFFFGGQSAIMPTLDTYQPLLVNYSMQLNTWYELANSKQTIVYGYFVVYLPIKLQLNLNYKISFNIDNKSKLAQVEMSI